MPYKRKGSDYYYLDLTLSDGRRLVRSTRETSKRRARQIESTVREMDTTGRRDVLNALMDGEISPRQLHSAKLAGRVPELLADAENPPLEVACREYLSYEPYYGAKWSVDSLLEVAPGSARLSWLRDVKNLRKVVAYFRREDYAAGTERRQMVYVGKLIAFHYDRGVRDELFGELDLREEDNRRCAWLTPEEMAGLREIASPRMWALISTAAATGLRLGELLSLRRRDVDLETGTIRVVSGKSDRARRKVPIMGPARETLAAWVEGQGIEGREKLWPELTNNMVWHRFDRYRRHLGLRSEEGHWFRFHDLRHHYAVYMARQGVPLTELRDLLGHSSLRMVERYALYTPIRREAQTRDAMREMGLEPGPAAEELHQSDQQPADTA